MKNRPLTKHMAKKIAAGILSLEQLDYQVLCQFDANEHLAAFVPDPNDRQRVIDAAEEVAAKLFNYAGREVLDRIAPPTSDEMETQSPKKRRR